MTRGKKIEVECKNKNCKKLFTARVADRKRGWGKFCSKSCKAKRQEYIQSGGYRDYLDRSYMDIDHTPNYPTIDDLPE